jgi:hemoglobin
MADAPESLFSHFGSPEAVRALVERFYEVMATDEPELARMHPVDETGRVLPEGRERFALFLIGWLGGPQDYLQQHGHPRLRMRHARVRVDTQSRNAWMRCMVKALDEAPLEPQVRAYLSTRLFDVADFLRNREG